MKSVTMMAVAVATLSIVGCGAATPEKVAVNFVEKIYHDGDFDGAAKLCTKKTAPLIALMASMAKDDKDFKKQVEKVKGAKIEASECKIDGDTATVKLKVTLPSGESEKMDDEAITLAKEDGEWKVNIKKD